MLPATASQSRWQEALAGLTIFWVGVICDEQTAVARELARGNRDIGMASSQRLLVHRGIQYPCILDTSHDDPDTLAANVLFAVPPHS